MADERTTDSADARVTAVAALLDEWGVDLPIASAISILITIDRENARIAAEHGRLRALVTDPTEREEHLAEALERIVQWSEAYPTNVFPEPDAAYLRKAHEVLTANGMILDRLSADAMRHVVLGVGKIAREALQK